MLVTAQSRLGRHHPMLGSRVEYAIDVERRGVPLTETRLGDLAAL